MDYIWFGWLYDNYSELACNPVHEHIGLDGCVVSGSPVSNAHDKLEMVDNPFDAGPPLPGSGA